MKKSYLPIGIYESYLGLMDKAEKLVHDFDVSEWFIVGSIQKYHNECRNSKEMHTLEEMLTDKLYSLANKNKHIKIADWNDVEKYSDFNEIHEKIIAESGGTRLGKSLRNVAATKLGVDPEDKIIESAFKYAAADVALTYGLANMDYIRMLNPRDMECFSIARKYAKKFGFDKETIKSVDIV